MSNPTPSTTFIPQPEKVLLLGYTGMNTLDWAGPLEVLHTVETASGSPFFEITIATVGPTPAATSSLPAIQTAERGIITPHIHIVSPSFDLLRTLEEYSTIVIPGGPMGNLLPLASDASNPIVELVRTFASLPPRNSRGQDRIILTICTGSFFLPAAGILRRMSGVTEPEVQITTHWSVIDKLQAFSEELAYAEKGSCAVVLKEKRFVDAGKLLGSGEEGEGVRLITSGGVANGMDATLYVVERRAGRECAEISAKRLEIGWRRDEGLINE